MMRWIVGVGRQQSNIQKRDIDVEVASNTSGEEERKVEALVNQDEQESCIDWIRWGTHIAEGQLAKWKVDGWLTGHNRRKF